MITDINISVVVSIAGKGE